MLTMFAFLLFIHFVSPNFIVNGDFESPIVNAPCVLRNDLDSWTVHQIYLAKQSCFPTNPQHGQYV